MKVKDTRGGGKTFFGMQVGILEALGGNSDSSRKKEKEGKEGIAEKAKGL